MKVDFEAIKRSADIVAVVEARGVKLKPVGRNHIGLCPFHADTNPSLVVTRANGLFRCPACNAAGNAIQFVARKEGISEREAAVKLLENVPGLTCGSPVPGPPAPPAPPASPPPNSGALFKRVVALYARTLHQDGAGLEYLRTRNLADPSLLESFAIGYCNGTLHRALPKSGAVIETLTTLGILNERGTERFYGRVVVPIHDSSGEVCGMYGRRLDDERPKHLYLPGPHRGVWNGAAARTHQSLLLTESVLDAMSLWQAGFKNAVALYGKEGWTADHDAMLQSSGVREVYLCLDNDAAGQEAALRLRERIEALGPAVHSVAWPDGIKDANQFFLSRTATTFEALLQAANPQTETVSEATAKAGTERIEVTADGFIAAYGPDGQRRYELRAIAPIGCPPSAARLKATIKAVSREPGRFHIDTVDFYLSRSRRAFIGEVARLYRETVETIEGDVNRLIPQLEAYAAKALQSQATVGPLSEEERAAGTRLGRHPDLAGEIVRDLEKLGMVGEEVNKLAGYLVMTSRRMDDPLALLIISGSGAGKSHLQDAVLALCPEEELIKLTSLSGQALFYKGEDSLRHKVLAVEEEAGANHAAYAIRNLISAKKLVIETTVKNPLTGKLETQVNVVHGPTAVFQTTTNPSSDAETRSRFIVTGVDESAAQTRAILDAQRQGHTLEGLLHKQRRAAIVSRHHALQRLLRPLLVVNPFEPLLCEDRSGAQDRLVMRRENPKYLHLILGVTFLYQMQRPVRTHPDLGEYIETTLDDIAVANEIAAGLFGHALDELSRPSRVLLGLIRDMVDQLSAKNGEAPEQLGFTRRAIREFSGWSDYQVKAHIKQLEELEYLAPMSGRRGQLFAYRLAWDGTTEARYLPGLLGVEEIRARAIAVGLLPAPCREGEADEKLEGAQSDLEGEQPDLEGGSRAQVGLGQNSPAPCGARPNGAKTEKLEGLPQMHISTLHEALKNGSVVSVGNGGFHEV